MQISGVKFLFFSALFGSSIFVRGIGSYPEYVLDTSRFTSETKRLLNELILPAGFVVLSEDSNGFLIIGGHPYDEKKARQLARKLARRRAFVLVSENYSQEWKKDLEFHKFQLRITENDYFVFTENRTSFYEIEKNNGFIVNPEDKKDIKVRLGRFLFTVDSEWYEQERKIYDELNAFLDAALSSDEQDFLRGFAKSLESKIEAEKKRIDKAQDLREVLTRYFYALQSEGLASIYPPSWQADLDAFGLFWLIRDGKIRVYAKSQETVNQLEVLGLFAEPNGVKMVLITGYGYLFDEALTQSMITQSMITADKAVSTNAEDGSDLAISVQSPSAESRLPILADSSSATASTASTASYVPILADSSGATVLNASVALHLPTSPDSSGATVSNVSTAARDHTSSRPSLSSAFESPGLFGLSNSTRRVVKEENMSPEETEENEAAREAIMADSVKAFRDTLTTAIYLSRVSRTIAEAGGRKQLRISENHERQVLAALQESKAKAIKEAMDAKIQAEIQCARDAAIAAEMQAQINAEMIEQINAQKIKDLRSLQVALRRVLIALEKKCRETIEEQEIESRKVATAAKTQKVEKSENDVKSKDSPEHQLAFYELSWTTSEGKIDTVYAPSQKAISLLRRLRMLTEGETKIVIRGVTYPFSVELSQNAIALAEKPQKPVVRPISGVDSSSRVSSYKRAPITSASSRERLSGGFTYEELARLLISGDDSLSGLPTQGRVLGADQSGITELPTRPVKLPGAAISTDGQSKSDDRVPPSTNKYGQQHVSGDNDSYYPQGRALDGMPIKKNNNSWNSQGWSTNSIDYSSFETQDLNSASGDVAMPSVASQSKVVDSGTTPHTEVRTVSQHAPHPSSEGAVGVPRVQNRIFSRALRNLFSQTADSLPVALETNGEDKSVSVWQTPSEEELAKYGLRKNEKGELYQASCASFLDLLSQDLLVIRNGEAPLVSVNGSIYPFNQEFFIIGNLSLEYVLEGGEIIIIPKSKSEYDRLNKKGLIRVKDGLEVCCINNKDFRLRFLESSQF